MAGTTAGLFRFSAGSSLLPNSALEYPGLLFAREPAPLLQDEADATKQRIRHAL
jgi:hypothetical protein